MGNPYTSVTVTNYNSNPPPDDGTLVPSNKVNWDKHKTKLADPLKTAIEAVNTNIGTALGKVVGGGGITSTAIDYAVVAGDQGKLISGTSSGITVTTPDATSVGSPFVFGVVNTSSGDITVDGNGSQTINGIASIGLGSGRGALFWTNGSNWFAIGYTSEVRPLPFSTPRGRLTLTTAVPVLATDVSDATTVYFTPYQGNTIMLPDANGNWDMFQFAELSQALSDDTKSPAAAGSSSLYDMFVWNDAGTITLSRGPAWSSATSRGTGGAGTTQLGLVDGVLCNAVAISNGPGASRGVYVGTIATDGDTQLNMQMAPSAASGGTANRLDVWNMYNRVEFGAINIDSATGWNPGSLGSKNGSTSNRITFVRGIDEEIVDVLNTAAFTGNAASAIASVGVALDATDAYASGSWRGTATIATSNVLHVTSGLRRKVGLGQHFIQAIEERTAGSSTGMTGGNTAALALTTRM